MGTLLIKSRSEERDLKAYVVDADAKMDRYHMGDRVVLAFTVEQSNFEHLALQNYSGVRLEKTYLPYMQNEEWEYRVEIFLCVQQRTHYLMVAEPFFNELRETWHEVTVMAETDMAEAVFLWLFQNDRLVRERAEIKVNGKVILSAAPPG